MNIKKAVNLINILLNISSKNEGLINETNQPVKFFGIGNYNVSFIGLNTVLKYQENLELLYSFNKEVENTISLKKFEESIISLIRQLRNENKKCDETILQNFFDDLLKIEKNESEILYELFGIEMKNQILKLGDFTIYNYPLAKHILFEKYPHLHEDIFFDMRKSDILLGIKVNARENNKAVEIADELVETFENVMNYMISDLNHQRSVGVFNYRGWKNTSRIICQNSTMGFHGSNDISLPVQIEDPFFTDVSQGNDKIWKLITKIDKSEIEKRLLQSIEWIGKGVYDKDKSKALVQLVFAIEGMLKYDVKSIITPSIVSQLSEWLAFIIQDNLEKRKEVAKYFKQIYRKRSAIIHGGAKTIDLDDIHIALQIAKLMIISFLKTEPFKNIKTMQELNELITEMKFK